MDARRFLTVAVLLPLLTPVEEVGAHGRVGAAAETPGSPHPLRDRSGYWQREGLYWGFGFGVGLLEWRECNPCDSDRWVGLALHGSIGGQINSRFAVYFDADLTRVKPTTMDYGIWLLEYGGTVGVQVWVLPRLWLKAGVGVSQQAFGGEDTDGTVDIKQGRDRSAAAPSISLVGGYEVYGRSGSYSLDLELRFGASSYTELYGVVVMHGSVQLAMHWYSMI
jgi:hypothetical protein